MLYLVTIHFRPGVAEEDNRAAAARGTFQVCTLPALPFEEFVGVVDDIRPPEESA